MLYEFLGGWETTTEYGGVFVRMGDIGGTRRLGQGETGFVFGGVLGEMLIERCLLLIVFVQVNHFFA